MKLRHLLLGTAVALGSATAATAAEGWYMSLGAGVNWLDDVDGAGLSSGSAFNQSTEFETGWAVAGAIGYDFGRWRVEFENAYRTNDGDTLCASSAGTNFCTVTTAEIWELSQMVNVLYDIPVGGRFEVSVGAGVGGNLVVLENGTAFESWPDSEDYVVAGQLIAQAAYELTSRWQLYLDYRFMFMDDANLDDPTEFANGDFIEIEKTEHTLLLGLRFDLQREGAAPAPAAPPPPPPAKSPKQFIVFFGFNKANLTPEAMRVVQDAAAAAKEYGSASIIVVGHTDTVGSNAYNNRLSMRRSQAVKDGLAANGVPASAVSTAGRGESELMVQTGDGVKEPQNRRATIDLN